MPEKQSKNSNLNILLVVAILIGVGLMLVSRFVQLNVLKASHGVDLVQFIDEVEDPRSSITEARRGTIYDQMGQPIAMDTTSYSMYAVLQGNDAFPEVDDADRVASVLSQYINMDQNQILDILLNPDAVQVEFAQAGQSLSAQTKAAIEAEELKGIYFASESTRKYVNDYFSSHLIGYATLEKNDEAGWPNAQITRGQIGVEAAYDDILSGESKLTENPDYAKRTHSMLGEDIYLTLDSRLQHYMEELLDYTFKRYKPEEISGYLVEVDTGKLLTAAQRPSFNLNTLEGIDKKWSNQLVEEAIEPGSTMKLLTQATAYDMNLYTPTELTHTGEVQIENVTVRDYNLYGWGEITFDEGLARSSNVTIIELVRRIGLDKWTEQLKTFGFGKSTESGLANESTGNISFDNSVSATMSAFGQGLSASPIQLLQAYNAIGNDGRMLKVQYINGIGENNTVEPVELGQVVSEQAADHILSIMVNAVNEDYGTAKAYSVPEVQVAAKTGTAEIANEDGTGYLKGANDYYFSVVSFFPANDPKYLLYFTMKRPTDDHNMMGSQILSEIFKPFVNYVLVYQ